MKYISYNAMIYHDMTGVPIWKKIGIRIIKVKSSKE